MVALWLPNAASESLEKKTSLCPFVSVILAPNTWSRHSFSQSNSGPKRASHGRTLAPNAASESLEKKKFVSICLGHRGPEHPKRASHGRTLGAKRRL